ncbi:MAG TPA: hypothetical protein ENJ26_04410 [Rhodobacteraceae bacterium]|nr:hypothetical protein [Paracoccaceae bacterium]
MLRAGFNKQVIGGVSNGSAEGLRQLVRLVEEGHFFPLIDRTFPFEHIVRAHAHVDTGRKKGAVVLSVLPETVAKQTSDGGTDAFIA